MTSLELLQVLLEVLLFWGFPFALLLVMFLVKERE